MIFNLYEISSSS